jgi:hypothetical protein
MRVKSIFLFVMIVLVVTLLNGCYCCCPVCPSPSPPAFKPQILAEISYCPVGDPPYNEMTKGMLNHMRDIAPLASYRWGVKNEYQLTSLSDTQTVLNQIGSTVNLIENFQSQPGCSGLPFGYVKYKNGSEDYVTAIIGTKIEFYKVIGPSTQLTKMYPDNTITEIVLH